MLVGDTDELMLISTGGVLIRIHASVVRMTSHAAQGVRLINLDEGTSLASLETVIEAE